ncbi:hypothetical protein RND71_022528 [Anisodus tanguticus]|uniref:Uncharacterized protein n=1 Tax=Anisodus tanguticus TaxID=243964 RepID=A0AAE1V595_9SOLA|nr:hypothetical protein RND71_022528 [Anisodus tanguticus]
MNSSRSVRWKDSAPVSSKPWGHQCDGMLGCLGWLGLAGYFGTPCPSTELDHVSQSKEWAAGFLKWGGLREAGFTGQ